MTMSIGKRKPFKVFFKERREKLGITQEQIASHMDTSAGKISKLETGKQKWSEDWLARAAFALDCEIVDLFYDPNGSTPEQRLAALPPDNRAVVLTLIDQLAAKKSS